MNRNLMAQRRLYASRVARGVCIACEEPSPDGKRRCAACRGQTSDTFHSRPQREWICVYCTACGPASSEEHQQQLTQAHLAECKARALYMARIARARAAMEATS